jgi:hypothetical protein
LREIVNVSASSLITKNTRSCGCLIKEVQHERGKSMRILNTYDLTGDYGIGYTLKNEEFYFDLEDYNKIKDYTWYLNKSGYTMTTVYGKVIFMHNLVMNPPENKQVDHIYHNTNDSRKENLRICETYENAINKIMQSNNTSGVVGVSWCKTKEKWAAYINYNKKRYSLGRYTNFEDAVKARKEAEEKYHGEFVCDL